MKPQSVNCIKVWCHRFLFEVGWRHKESPRQPWSLLKTLLNRPSELKKVFHCSNDIILFEVSIVLILKLI